MQILVDHIGYILMTLAVGVIIGWRTYPALERVRNRTRKESVRATARHDEQR